MSSFYVISDETSFDDVAVVAMGGEIDYDASPELRQRLFNHIKAGRRRLVLDLNAATFIDSTSIGVLVGALTRLREGGGSLTVVCPDGRSGLLSESCPEAENSIRRVFQITGLDAAVHLCESREEALFELAAS